MGSMNPLALAHLMDGNEKLSGKMFWCLRLSLAYIAAFNEACATRQLRLLGFSSILQYILSTL